MNSVTLHPAEARDLNGREGLGNLIRRPGVWAILITLLAFGLRVWALEAIPPGWRDDELIETLVISRNILHGDLAFYYADASGHEALYHMLNSLFLAWFGPTGPGIRLLSAVLGTVAVPLTYVLGRRMFGAATGLTAATLLAVSFWGLMYSRIGLRQILTPALALPAFYFFWRAMERKNKGSSLRWFALSGLFLGLGFHAYFASRGAPLIPAAWVVYLLIVAPSRLRGRWRGLALLAGVTAIVALPLLLAVAAQPEAEGRVGELALPLIEARAGNFDLMLSHAAAALTMPHATGDPEWLYNIPYRPLFGPVGAVFFWSGVALAFWWSLGPIASRVFRGTSRNPDPYSFPSAFLLLWWLGGISPAVLSVPPASLGHVILAQPAFYLLAALPVAALAGSNRLPAGRRAIVAGAAALLLIGSTAVRDLPAYFVQWPARGMVRFLYHADVEDVADFILSDPANPWPTDFGITGPLAGPWNRIAFDLALGGAKVRPRWFNPERALLLWPNISFSGYPAVESPYAEAFELLPEGAHLSGDYVLSRIDPSYDPFAGEDRIWVNEAPVCFSNGLCWTAASYNPETGLLQLAWQLEGDLVLPEIPLISNPPPPGVYSGLRLSVFAQLLDDEGGFLVGDDGLWVDAETLHADDSFIQRHYLVAPDGSQPAAVNFGLYDPMTGERLLTSDGQDRIILELD